MPWIGAFNAARAVQCCVDHDEGGTRDLNSPNSNPVAQPDLSKMAQIVSRKKNIAMSALQEMLRMDIWLGVWSLVPSPRCGAEMSRDIPSRRM